MNERLRNGLVNLGLVVASVVVFFVVLEGYFVVVDPQIHQISQHDSLFQYDKEQGWTFIPHQSATYSSGEYSNRIQINSQGFRDKEYDFNKTRNIKRAVVVGDSFTSSLGVKRKEMCTEVLESNLLRNWEVINMGVNGYGTTQEFLMLKNRGLKYNPDLVILVFYVRNDLDDNMGTFDWVRRYRRPLFVLDNKTNELKLTNIPVPTINEKYEYENEKENDNPRLLLRFKRFLVKHSNAYKFVSDRLSSNPNAVDFLRKLRIAEQIGGEHLPKERWPPEIRLCSNTPDQDIVEGYNLTKMIFMEIDKIAKKNNASTLIVIAPTIVQVNKDKWEYIKKAYNLNNQDYNLSKPNDILVDFCRENNFPVLDLLPEFRKQAENGTRLYYDKNQHWNAAGNKLAAELIYDKLIEEELVPLGGE